MLKMEEVSKSYQHRGQVVKALDGATIDIAKGDFVSVVGPSGSGKSTLLLMLGGMLSPSSGRVLLGGQSIYDLSSDGRARLRKENIGFVFQTFNLVPYLTALENVQIPLYLRGVDEKTQEQRATGLLERVGLGDRLDHKPTELSVGQQQRVALARALVSKPDLILADEPTGNVDPAMSERIMKLFVELNKLGAAVIVATHNLRLVQTLGKPVLRISDGRVSRAPGAGGIGPSQLAEPSLDLRSYHSEALCLVQVIVVGPFTLAALREDRRDPGPINRQRGGRG